MLGSEDGCRELAQGAGTFELSPEEQILQRLRFLIFCVLSSSQDASTPAKCGEDDWSGKRRRALTRRSGSLAHDSENMGIMKCCTYPQTHKNVSAKNTRICGISTVTSERKKLKSLPLSLKRELTPLSGLSAAGFLRRCTSTTASASLDVAVFQMI